MNAPHYHINLYWSRDNACWIVDVPDLRYWTSRGDTPAEAIANVQEAMTGWLDVAREKNIPIPEPRYRPAIYAA